MNGGSVLPYPVLRKMSNENAGKIRKIPPETEKRPGPRDNRAPAAGMIGCDQCFFPEYSLFSNEGERTSMRLPDRRFSSASAIALRIISAIGVREFS